MTTITRCGQRIWSKVTVPLFSAANWGGQGCIRAAISKAFSVPRLTDKWLEAHGLEHWTHFYTDYGIALQKRFFGYFLKGEKNGWEKATRECTFRCGMSTGLTSVSRMNGRSPEPNGRDSTLIRSMRPSTADVPDTEATKTFDATGEGVTFLSAPMLLETEITGPSALKLFVSSSTRDADIFAVLRVFSADMKEIVFMGAIDPHTPIGQGWLRASHRKLDKELSRDWRPYHTHDERHAARGWRDRRSGHRDLADEHRGAARVSDRGYDPRQGLRIWRRQRGKAI